MTISRVGGPMLNQNLVRQGVDLSFETDLLYLDVNNMRIGVNTDVPSCDLEVIGNAKISNNLETATITQISATAPGTPSTETMAVYVTAIGISPNREVAYKLKNELGEEIIISSILI